MASSSVQKMNYGTQFKRQPRRFRQKRLLKLLQWLIAVVVNDGAYIKYGLSNCLTYTCEMNEENFRVFTFKI